MKIRTDFVTNSSSSSFVLGDTRENGDLPLTINIKVEDLLRIVDHVIITTIEQLNQEIEDQDYYLSDEEIKKCKQIIEKYGRVILFRCYSDGEEDVTTYLANYGLDDVELPDNIIIIRDGDR